MQAVDEVREISHEDAGARLDQVAARLIEGFSRERLKAWILEGSLTLDGQPVGNAAHKGQPGPIGKQLHAAYQEVKQASRETRQAATG